MPKYYYKINETSQVQTTPYDHFCSRDSILLSDVFAEGERVGIKKAVNWIKYYLNIPEIKDTYADKILRPQLKSKLKEWGID